MELVKIFKHFDIPQEITVNHIEPYVINQKRKEHKKKFKRVILKELLELTEELKDICDDHYCDVEYYYRYDMKNKCWNYTHYREEKMVYERLKRIDIDFDMIKMKPSEIKIYNEIERKLIKKTKTYAQFKNKLSNRNVLLGGTSALNINIPFNLSFSKTKSFNG